MKKLNYRLFLYSPAAAAVTLANSSAYFLGELYADNVQVNLKLQDVSTISFSLPQFINGAVNPRIAEVFDNYVLELWYGQVDTATYEKIRFIIYKTPQEFTNDEKFLYRYEGYSLESLLEFKQLVSWNGIEISDYYRVISYNNTASPSNAFTETGQSNLSILTNSASNPIKYIRVTPSSSTVLPLDVFIFETRKNISDDVTSRNSLISYESTSADPDNYPPYNEDGFKPGYYYLKLGIDGYVDYIYIGLPENITSFDGKSTAAKLFSYHVYDNPVSRFYAFGINKNNGATQNNFYFDLVIAEATTGTATYNGFTYSSQKEYYKNGLTIKQIMLGDQEETTLNSDGIIYNSGFTLGTVHADLLNRHRSNIEFNNLTKYQAIKQIAETFDSIAVFDTINNTVSFYPEDPVSSNPWTSTDLSIRYGAYLSALSKDIDSSKIITMANGLGKDQLPIALVTPTGTNYWEDYQYFLDDYFISDTTGFTIAYDATRGLSITYPAGTYDSKWMPAVQAKVLGGWQYTRDYFHSLMIGETSPINAAHNKYEDIYTERLDALRALVKLETEVNEREALQFKYFTLKEHYITQNKTSPGTYDDKELLYTNKYNEVSFQVNNAKRRLKKLENLVYDKNQDGSTTFTFKTYATTINEANEIKLLKPNYNLFVGMSVSGPGIPANSEIIAIQDGLNFQINNDATATVNVNNAVELTFTEDLPESYAHKMLEVATILDKSSWYLNGSETTTIDLDLLKSFQREAVVSDGKIDDEFELLSSVIVHVNENKLPKVTIQINVADILAAEEAYDDWNKIKLGKTLNIYLPELDVDEESLIREVSIDFEQNTLNFVTSNVRNYNRNILTSAFKLVRELKNSDMNFSSYIYDKINYVSGDQIEDIQQQGESGENPTTTGAEDENGEAPENNQEGSDNPPVNDDSIDDETETFEYLATSGVLINNGKLLAFEQKTPALLDPYTLEVEVSAQNGFEIRKVEGSAENDDLAVTRQMYIDTDGNAVFSGFVSVGQTDPNVDFDENGIFLGVKDGDPKVSFKTDSTTYLKYDPSATYDLQVEGNAKIGPLYVGNSGSSFSTINTTNGGLTFYSGNNPLINDGNNATINITDQTLEITAAVFNLSNWNGVGTFEIGVTFYDGINGGGSTISGSVVVLATDGNPYIDFGLRTILRAKSFTISILNFLSPASLNISDISLSAYKPSLQINDFNVNSIGQVNVNQLTVSRRTAPSQDRLQIKTTGLGTGYNNITLTLPSSALTQNSTVRLPDNSGTIALVNAAQTWTGNQIFSNDVTVSGNFTVNGTTTNLNSTNLVVEDKNIIIADVTTPTDTTANGGGITLKGATDKTIIWYKDYNAWEFNQGISLNAGQPLKLSGISDATHEIFHDASTDYDVVEYSTGFQLRHYSTGNQLTLTGSNGRVGIGTIAPAELLDVNGNITHKGLVMTTGTNVDQTKQTTFTSALTTAWTDVTGVSGTYLTTGSYIVQIESNGEYYTGQMSWFSGSTTSAIADEIQLHRAGPTASAARIYARLIRVSAGTLKLQVAASTSVGSHTMTFKFRRTI